MWGIVAGLICAFMVALRSVFLKDTDLSIFLLVPVAGIGLMLFSWLYFGYQYGKNPERYAQAKPGRYELTSNPFKNVFLPENCYLSLISQFRYFAEFGAIYFLPIGLSVPMLTLTTFSSYYFEYLLQGTSIRPGQYLGGLLSVVGAILLHWKILQKKEHKTLWYKLGMSLLLIAIISEGYILTKYKIMLGQITEEETFINETTFAGLIMIPLLLFYLFYLRKKLHQHLPRTRMETIVIWVFFLLVPLGVFFRLLALQHLEEIFFVLLLNLSGIFAMFLGSFIWKEAIYFPQLVGAILLIIAVMVAYPPNKKNLSLQK